MDNTAQYSAQIKSVPDDSFKFARTVVNVNKYVQNDLERREGITSDNCGPMSKTSYDEKANTTFYCF